MAVSYTTILYTLHMLFSWLTGRADREKARKLAEERYKEEMRRIADLRKREAEAKEEEARIDKETQSSLDLIEEPEAQIRAKIASLRRRDGTPLSKEQQEQIYNEVISEIKVQTERGAAQLIQDIEKGQERREMKEEYPDREIIRNILNKAVENSRQREEAERKFNEPAFKLFPASKEAELRQEESRRNEMLEEEILNPTRTTQDFLSGNIKHDYPHNLTQAAIEAKKGYPKIELPSTDALDLNELKNDPEEGSRERSEGSRESSEGYRERSEGSRESSEGYRERSEGSRERSEGYREAEDLPAIGTISKAGGSSYDIEALKELKNRYKTSAYLNKLKMNSIAELEMNKYINELKKERKAKEDDEAIELFRSLKLPDFSEVFLGYFGGNRYKDKQTEEMETLRKMLRDISNIKNRRGE